MKELCFGSVVENVSDKKYEKTRIWLTLGDDPESLFFRCDKDVNLDRRSVIADNKTQFVIEYRDLVAEGGNFLSERDSGYIKEDDIQFLKYRYSEKYNTNDDRIYPSDDYKVIPQVYIESVYKQTPLGPAKYNTDTKEFELDPDMYLNSELFDEETFLVLDDLRYSKYEDIQGTDEEMFKKTYADLEKLNSLSTQFQQLSNPGYPSKELVDLLDKHLRMISNIYDFYITANYNIIIDDPDYGINSKCNSISPLVYQRIMSSKVTNNLNPASIETFNNVCLEFMNHDMFETQINPDK